MKNVICTSYHQGAKVSKYCVEALACNTKVVASNCVSGPAEILENNRYGILAHVNDAESLSRSMYEYLMCDNRTDNRADAFSIASIGVQYQKLFE